MKFPYNEMNILEVKKLLRNLGEENIDFDEPHVSLRCEENNITQQKIIHILLRETDRLADVIEDRSQVYKLYFKLHYLRNLLDISQKNLFI